jgi:hypothetical protein
LYNTRRSLNNQVIIEGVCVTTKALYEHKKEEQRQSILWATHNFSGSGFYPTAVKNRAELVKSQQGTQHTHILKARIPFLLFLFL